MAAFVAIAVALIVVAVKVASPRANALKIMTFGTETFLHFLLCDSHAADSSTFARPAIISESDVRGAVIV